MKWIAFLFCLVMVAGCCDDVSVMAQKEEMGKIVFEGEIERVEYIPARWTQCKETILYSKSGAVVVLRYNHLSIPSENIRVTRIHSKPYIFKYHVESIEVLENE